MTELIMILKTAFALIGVCFAAMTIGGSFALGVALVCRWLEWAPINTTIHVNNLGKPLEQLRLALAAVVRDVNDYERVNNLAPAPGRTECWDSVAHAKRVLADVGNVGTPPMSEAETRGVLAEKLADIAGRCSLEADRLTIIRAANALNNTYTEYCMNEKCPRGSGTPVEIVRGERTTRGTP